jgi:hypothetical protein
MDQTMDEKDPVEVRFLDLLHEIRDEMCSRCSGRPVGDPRGNPCGVQLSLDQVLEALKRAAARHTPDAPDEPETSFAASFCPLSMDQLTTLAGEVAGDLERRRQQRERLLASWDD